MQTPEELCVICKEKLDSGQEVVHISQKGADGINASSRSRGSDVVATAGISVHVVCRKRFTDKKTIEIKKRQTAAEAIPRKSARFHEYAVSSATHCLFCDTFVDFSSKHKPKSEHVKIRTTEFTETIKRCCESRCDEWSFNVKGRLEYYLRDLHAADCVYHHTCSVNFRSGKNIPRAYSSDDHDSKKGRPTNEEQHQAFLQTCAYLEENDDEQLLIGDLITKMEEYLQGSQSSVYERRHMKRKLLERYGDKIIISGKSGKADVVTLRETANEILIDYHKKSKECDIELQKIYLVEAAAKIIRSDIKSLDSPRKDVYPSPNDITAESALDYIPNSLKLLLSKAFAGQDASRKIGAIGQSIMQATRPRGLLCPLQIGLSVQLHHNFRSRYLIDVLHQLGYCSSYAEVTRFERNAALASGSGSFTVDENTAVLLAADNVDHDVCTLDGKNTFHGMGMIAAITPKIKIHPSIHRRNVGDNDIKKIATVDIREYRHARSMLRDISFRELPVPTATISRLSLLWQISSAERSGPSWSGTMQAIHGGSSVSHPGVASITFLPIIDMSPTDMTCIFSTLLYLSKIARDQKVPCIITFDQPLFWKASQIINEQRDLQDIVLMLGSFHTLMNLLGAVGTLMNGSGLSEVLQEIYGPNAVQHMMSGKAVSRAIRGHMIVDAALSTLLVADVFPRNEDGTPHDLHKEACDLLDDVMTAKQSVEDVESSNALSQIATTLDAKKTDLQSTSQTSQLWLEYQRMINIARTLITADRTGSWDLHLQAMLETIPIIAAAGHHNYLKSIYLYLQKMLSLPSENPAVNKMFQEGKFVVRRSDRLWAGLGTDLVIEQVLMRSLKSRGGLTRGSGFTDIQRTTWLFSMPLCSTYNLAMQEYTRVLLESSEQHKEMRGSRQIRDSNDIKKVLERLESLSPFHSTSGLCNIVTGLTADPGVNVHQLHSIGTNIVVKMIGKQAFTYSAKRSDKVKTLGSASAVVITDASDIEVDPALLFQRMMTVATGGDMNLEDVMCYELCAYPPALFESRSILRKPDKSQLAHAIIKYTDTLRMEEVQEIQCTDQYVLDGGSLLHRVSWRQDETYDSIANSYADFTLKTYGKAIIVFDGYSSSPTIKDMTHRRRSTKTSRNVNLSPGMKFVGQKEHFLANENNKQAFISLVGEMLKKHGCTVHNADGDADVDIVRAAVSSSENATTTVIGEDTDLLILLLYHAKDSGFKLYYRSDIRRGPSPNPVYDILSIQSLLGNDICKYLLFVHAFTGCDSTSRIFSIGKAKAFDTLMKVAELRSVANTFCSDCCQHSDIEAAGRKAMLLLYGCKTLESTNALRHRMLVEKVATAKSFVTPERLPPTDASTKYHSFRTYFQILIWKSTEERIDAEQWGWYVKNNSYYPTACDKPPAPNYLLNMIRCSCKTKCATSRCGCKRNGMPCSAACGECQISGCDNNPSTGNLSDDSDEED